jgi:hypothetical protein
MPPHLLTRRTLVAAGAAGLGGLALGACKGSSDAPKKGTGLNLLVVTPEVPNGRAGRLVFVLQNDDRDPVTPKQATFRFGPSPEKMTSPVAEAEVHTDAAPATSYLSLTVQLSPVGTVWAEVTADGKRATAPVRVVDRLSGVGEGQALPSVVTPSPGDLAGVEVACTRQPACPLHDISLDKALALKKPLAVLVSTPAFCQTAVCGPVLDVLLKAAPTVGDAVRLLHLEVYAQRPREKIEGTPLSPAVKAFALDAEPSLFLVGADGIVRQRIDGVFGTGEVTRALAALKG